MKAVSTVDFESYARSVPAALDAVAAGDAFARANVVILKPNLTQGTPFPVTTPAELTRAVIDYVKAHSKADVIVAEGAGSASETTEEVFDALGYRSLGVELVDLNTSECERLAKKGMERLSELHLPKIVGDCMLVSLPVLKAHSMARVTLTMKNMMGLLPPERYQMGGHWKKSSFHRDLHRAIYELNCYRAPDLSLIDATVGMAEAHLWGPKLDPPGNKLICGFDPVAVDAAGCKLLGVSWKSVGHLKMADGVLGKARAAS